MRTATESPRAWGISPTALTASFAALALCLAAPLTASADTITTWTANVLVTTNAGGNPNSTPPFQPVGGTESYGSNYAVSVPGIPAGGAQNISTGCCSTASTVPTQSSLTSVALGIQSTNSGTGVVANANAYANLATGSVGVSGSSSKVGVSGGTSDADAVLEDQLTFSILGATSSTVTDIGVQWAISGGLSSDSTGEANMQGGLTFGNSQMTTEWNSDAGALTNNDGTNADGWQSFTIVSNTANSVIIDGVYQLVGADPTIPLELLLECSSSNDASCDFYDTESINFTLPDGVTYTSASGDFLAQSTAPTPEPGSFLLFGTALLSIGWTLRHYKSIRPGDHSGDPLPL